MNKDIILEAEYFLSSFFWGIALLFLYDCIRIFRRIKHHIWIAIATEDCLFWGVAGIFVFHMVYERNYGIIRAFAAGAMGIGMWLYLVLISRWYVHTVTLLIKKAGDMVTRFIYQAVKPFRFMFENIDKRIGKISLFLRKHVNKFLTKRKKQLKTSYKNYKIKIDAKKILKKKKKDDKLQNKINRLDSKKFNKRKGKLHNEVNSEQKVKGILEKIESHS